MEKQCAVRCAQEASIGMNSLSVIFPDKHSGVWMFDDERVDLQGEPFIAGADVMME
jgi:hypothetical protein